MPDIQTIAFSGNEERIQQRQKVKDGKNERVWRRTPVETKISKHPELTEKSREFYKQLSKNIKYYQGIITIKKMVEEFKKKGYPSKLAFLDNFISGEVDFININYAFQLQDISGIPVGSWLMADIEYLHTRAIIFFDGIRACHTPAYMTDGVFFYGKHIDKLIPLGSPVLNDWVDKGYNPQVIKL